MPRMLAGLVCYLQTAVGSCTDISCESFQGAAVPLNHSNCSFVCCTGCYQHDVPLQWPTCWVARLLPACGAWRPALWWCWQGPPPRSRCLQVRCRPRLWRHHCRWALPPALLRALLARPLDLATLLWVRCQAAGHPVRHNAPELRIVWFVTAHHQMLKARPAFGHCRCCGQPPRSPSLEFIGCTPGLRAALPSAA